jgi:hypothetical protein
MKTVPDFAGALKDANRFARVELLIALPLPLALTALGLLQLALRHPGLDARTRERGEEIGRTLQKGVSVTPALASVAAAGWDPEFDAPSSAEATGGG